MTNDTTPKRAPKRVTFDNREDALEALKRTLEDGRRTINRAQKTMHKIDRALDPKGTS
jgi:hypothetical protein